MSINQSVNQYALAEHAECDYNVEPHSSCFFNFLSFASDDNVSSQQLYKKISLLSSSTSLTHSHSYLLRCLDIHQIAIACGGQKIILTTTTSLPLPSPSIPLTYASCIYKYIYIYVEKKKGGRYGAEALITRPKMSLSKRIFFPLIRSL